jgi:hypothetical protein
MYVGPHWELNFPPSAKFVPTRMLKLTRLSQQQSARFVIRTVVTKSSCSRSTAHLNCVSNSNQMFKQTKAARRNTYTLLRDQTRPAYMSKLSPKRVCMGNYFVDVLKKYGAWNYWLSDYSAWFSIKQQPATLPYSRNISTFASCYLKSVFA